MGKILSPKPPAPPPPDPELIRQRQEAEKRAAEEKAAAERWAEQERRGWLLAKRGKWSLLGSADQFGSMAAR